MVPQIKTSNLRQIHLFDSFHEETDQDILTSPPYLKRERTKLDQIYFSKMEERLDLGRLVGYGSNKMIPFLRLYRYKEAFSFDLANKLLREFNASSKGYVFDPFCGMGTSLLASMAQRIPSIGTDMLPVAVFISKTIPLFLKLPENCDLNLRAKKICLDALKSKPAKVADEVKIMKLAFDSEVLLDLRKIKAAIDQLSNPYKDIFSLFLLSMLEDVSYTSKDGQFLRLELGKKTKNPYKELAVLARRAQQDIDREAAFFNLTRKEIRKYFPRVYEDDTRNLTKVPFKNEPTLIITSPPYANRYDYTRSYSLELCFNFVENFEQLKGIRHRVLRSHIESKVSKSDVPPHPAVQEIIDSLSLKKLNNPKIPHMLTAYFCDMDRALGQWNQILAKGANVAMVVDNVRFEGEMVPVDLILSDLALQHGFHTQKIIVARYKGNSSQQMKKYGRVPVRESILIWRKK